MGRAQDLVDPAVEALHQPVGLGAARRREAVLDVVAGAQRVEDMAQVFQKVRAPPLGVRRPP
ncbi:hypothetical protein HH1059_13870 [Halorhodospira halochloris]|uniref:Uncharacterized protein n=1 Tax=Halorhodospira halochloris TaxID=1052 RepID=A0A2Z6EZP3_HALHR|nr:hypothetical protein HH1059_13870 [Halorhodospira halochloris]